MKLAELTNHLLKGLEASAKPSNLSRQLSAPVGQHQTALVNQTAPVTNEQRQLLLNKTMDQLAQLNRMAPTPARQHTINQLIEQQALLKSPLLKLVRLQVNNQPLVTYTDRPVQAGQTVSLQVASPNRLTFSASNTETNAKAQTVAEALRQALPQRDQPALLDQLSSLLKLPQKQQRMLLPPDLQQALKTVAQQLRHPSQLTNPQALKTAMADSGVFLEQKLAQALGSKLPSGRAPVSAEAQNDLKGALIQLVSRLQAELARSSGSDQNTPSPVSARPASLPSLDQWMQQLQSAAPELNLRTLRTQLMTLLHQQTLASLARIQFQQLQSLAQRQGQAEGGPQPIQPFSLELPVRHGQDVHSIYIQLHQELEPEEDPADQEEDEAPPDSEKQRRWSLMLSFPLPEAGNFYAQLTLLGDQVSAKLWAEKAETLTEVRQKSETLKQDLEREGIVVQRLECLRGKPPAQRQAVQYSLVDVTT